MTIEVLYSKIHRVRVTGAELHYIGSITLDSDLELRAASESQSAIRYVRHDIGGPEVMTYQDMMQRYAAVAGAMGADPVEILATVGDALAKKGITLGEHLHEAAHGGSVAVAAGRGVARMTFTP